MMYKRDKGMIKRNNRESTFAIEPLPSTIVRTKNEHQINKHLYKEIIFLFSGEGKHMIDDELIEFTPNTLYLINIGQVHSYIEGTNIQGYSIKYKNEFIPSSGLSYKSSFYSKLNGYIADLNYIKLAKKDVKNIRSHFQSILEEYKQPDEAFTSKAIVQYLFVSFMLKIERMAREIVIITSKTTTSNHKKTLYVKFLSLLEENFMTNHSMDFYTEKLSLSRRKLSDLVKEFSGITAKRYLLNRIILEAKRLLAYSNHNLKEICYDLGFESPAYFSTLFKEMTGKTPNEYRKMQQKK
ncbi:AraC family transcriptional regulator [Aquimarina hainanensis]|uniref:AraC family transcriptional regulator n=1 Tax=Aquimarina hainanensis TaxID=1578017 RepID=A0ABW5N719_9FLAO|nr:helix-turn-helix domain-containing protein [Aquimarina sp. TRL1]QKX05448.1 helix-turn-helix domain-containing protein [Aquimarina sp. TRL1]